MLAILHAIPDTDNPHAIVAKLLDAVPPGSFLVISHGASDLLDQETIQSVTDSWNSRGQQQMAWRSREQIARFFTGTDLAEPGLVRVDKWRPEPGITEEGRPAWLCAVGRKR
jgi:hypothetical protein